MRVFCGPAGEGGEQLGVFLDGRRIADEHRPLAASELGFCETAFVDDDARGVVRIFTPGGEVDFADRSLVAAAWLLTRKREPVERLRPPAGEVPVREAGGLTLIVGAPGWAPGLESVQLSAPEEVERFEGPPARRGVLGVWAWLDEREGVIRQRVFSPRGGFDEEEATGAAAIRLSAMLDRSLDIRQGRGSRIVARPVVEGMVEVGGRVELDEVRAYPG